MQFPNPNIDPEYETLERAIEHARRLARTMQAAHTVVAEVSDHRLGFHSFSSETYAGLRERGLTRAMAPVASVLPNGTIEFYQPIREIKSYVQDMRHELP